MENISEAFAVAWNENQGTYSETIAKRLIKFLKIQGLKANSVLDICCGSANFLEKLKEAGLSCSGTEILDSYIAYDKRKFPDMNFYKTEHILDFDNLGKYDIISCNHDVINMLPTLDDWSKFFKLSYSHLNNGGILVFDYYSKRKLQDWNEVVFEENQKLDYIKHVFCDGISKTTIENVYFINLDNESEQDSLNNYVEKQYGFNDKHNKYKKTENISVEYYFDNSKILEELKKANYRYLITTDANFTPISSIEDVNRVHVIAIKRENV